MLLSLALKWAEQQNLSLLTALARITCGPAALLSGSAGVPGIGQLAVGGPADLCIARLDEHWVVDEHSLCSQGTSTPFSGYELLGRVQFTLVGGRLVFQR